MEDLLGGSKHVCMPKPSPPYWLMQMHLTHSNRIMPTHKGWLRSRHTKKSKGWWRGHTKTNFACFQGTHWRFYHCLRCCWHAREVPLHQLGNTLWARIPSISSSFDLLSWCGWLAHCESRKCRIGGRLFPQTNINYGLLDLSCMQSAHSICLSGIEWRIAGSSLQTIGDMYSKEMEVKEGVLLGLLQLSGSF